MTSNIDLFTIGHSNLPAGQFLALLKAHSVNAIMDVRSVPFSRRNPWFSTRPLSERLQNQGISYVAMGDALGGRPASSDLYCDGIADYDAMAKTEGFRAGLARVVSDLRKHRACLMCAEREPLDCHRCLLVGRALAHQGHSVGHILGDGTVEPHAATEERLVSTMGGPPDLFGNRDLRLAEAYRRRASKVAARASERTRPGRTPRTFMPS